MTLSHLHQIKSQTERLLEQAATQTDRHLATVALLQALEGARMLQSVRPRPPALLDLVAELEQVVIGCRASLAKQGIR